MAGWSVMLRGIRHRSGRSLVVLSLAGFATAAAVLAPAYGRAAQQSVLTDALSAAPATAAAVTVTAEGSADTAEAAHQPVGDTQSVVAGALARAPRLAAVLDRPVGSVSTDTSLQNTRGGRFAARLAWHQGACEHLRVTGDCAIDAEQVLVSERAAAEAGIEVGDKITVRPVQGGNAGRAYEVVGLYTPLAPQEAHWGNNGYFAQGQSGGEGAPRLDAVFAGAEDDVRLGDAVPVTLSIAYPLRPEQVRLDDVSALRSELGGLGLALNAAELQVETALPSIVEDAAKDQDALARTVPIIAVPLVLLAFVVLLMLVAALTEERGPELALARLRGYGSGGTIRFGLGETLLLIVLGAPLGLAAGLGAVELAARTVLADGVHVEPRWPVFAAAVGGLLLACAAAWLAARATLGRSVLGLLRRVPQRGTWRAGVLEGVAAALAVASLAAALRDRSAPLALLAPAALAIVAGVLAGRLLSLWSRARLGLARRRGKLPAMLSAAQLSRRPGAARTVAVLTAAVALLAFSATAWDVAADARAQRADDAVGAPTVYAVSAAHPQALVDALAAADPSNHSMAVVRADELYNSQRVELIGVQSQRLPAVAIWRGYDQAGLTELAGRLRQDAGRPAEVSGTLTARVTATVGETAVRVGALVSAPGEPPSIVWLGKLRKGTRDYSAAVPGCADNTCRLVGLAVGRDTGESGPVQATLAIEELRSAGQPLALRFDTAAAWKFLVDRTPNATVKVTSGAHLGVSVTSADQGDVLISYLDTPQELPAVLAGAAPSSDDPEHFDLPGFAEAPQSFGVLEKAALLPRAGEHGLLFDLDLAVRAASVTQGLSDATDLRYEVWAAADAPADLATKLAGQGVRVLRTETVPDELDRLGRRAPALGLRLYLLAGIAAALLALGVLALSTRLGAGERRAELAALRVTGVRPGVLRRGLRRERLALLGLPILVGLLVGVGAAALMLPGIPLVTVGTAGAPGLAGDVLGALVPSLALDALPLAVAGAALVLLLAVLRGGRLVKRATPELIRGGNR
ncbi:FtsX-like permease family protein [Catellatospora sp. NPDC049609]|uniref:FtsX-like permease family protein n=1 Tax=Catellatospora sp. NPDC049609 TaxID=3155505 RepID=UPI00342E4349